MNCDRWIDQHVTSVRQRKHLSSWQQYWKCQLILISLWCNSITDVRYNPGQVMIFTTNTSLKCFSVVLTVVIVKHGFNINAKGGHRIRMGISLSQHDYLIIRINQNCSSIYTIYLDQWRKRAHCLYVFEKTRVLCYILLWGKQQYSRTLVIQTFQWSGLFLWSHFFHEYYWSSILKFWGKKFKKLS